MSEEKKAYNRYFELKSLKDKGNLTHLSQLNEMDREAVKYIEAVIKRGNRSPVLLRAAYDLLKRADDNHFVDQATSIVTHYDGVDCDGYCLMEEIADELGLEESTEPIPLDGTDHP